MTCILIRGRGHILESGLAVEGLIASRIVSSHHASPKPCRCVVRREADSVLWLSGEKRCRVVCNDGMHDADIGLGVQETNPATTPGCYIISHNDWAVSRICEHIFVTYVSIKVHTIAMNTWCAIMTPDRIWRYYSISKGLTCLLKPRSMLCIPAHPHKYKHCCWQFPNSVKRCFHPYRFRTFTILSMNMSYAWDKRRELTFHQRLHPHISHNFRWYSNQ